jgi:fimbrial chaperone protein
MLRKLSGLLAAAALLSITTTVDVARAYQVSPMIYDLRPVGQGSSTVIRVNNTNAQAITIEVVVEKRTFDQHGKESRTPADADFIVFPPQAVIQPGVTQALRVEYIGPPTIPESVMYTVTVKQVPITMPADGPSGVQFVFNFSTLANVVPLHAKSHVEVTSLTASDSGLVLTLTNSGNKYANLATSTVTLSGAGYTKALDVEIWRKALGSSWILPGAVRVITLPRPADAPAGDLRASIGLIETTP